jgi:hypothetical protein
VNTVITSKFYTIASTVETQEDVAQSQRNPDVLSRSNILLGSKRSLQNKRYKSKHSQDHRLKKDNSFVVSNLDSQSMLAALMDYDPQTTNKHTSMANSKFNRTSLILPPLSIGTMQKTFANIDLSNSKFDSFIE